MNKKTLKITYAGVLIALSILLPMLFHTVGMSSGSAFLPMHIPALLAGFILGPIYGFVVGISAPLINAFVTGMPPIAKAPLMMVELAVYGACAGLLYHQLGFKNRKYGTHIALVLTMIVGRIAYALSLYVVIDLLKLPFSSSFTIIASLVTGMYGIIIQLVFIPVILFLLKRGGLLDGLSAKSDSTPKE